MELELFQVDAFCKDLFSGNPAAVCPLDSWPEDGLLQNIAAENNLAETAYYVPEGDGFRLRWFTPAVEVNLCGHATLATAHVLFEHKGFAKDTIVFYSRSGELRVKRSGDKLVLDFPADVLTAVPVTDEMSRWFGTPPLEVYKGKTDYMLVFAAEKDIAGLQPDIELIAGLPVRGVIATARGEQVDFVSRFFAPQSGIAEDPATGSAHTTLTPYWSSILHKKELEAIQLSARKGFLHCKDAGARIEISGKARTYLSGRIWVS